MVDYIVYYDRFPRGMVVQRPSWNSPNFIKSLQITFAMRAIRTYGRLPNETGTVTKDERQLARKLRRARREGKLSGEEEAELAAMSANDSELAAMSANDSLMQAIRTLGRLPKETRTATKDEQQVALNLHRARRAGKLSGEEAAEVAAMIANELGTLQEADAPPDPMDPFADEAANSLEQDVLMATNGIRPRTVMRRIARYKST